MAETMMFTVGAEVTMAKEEFMKLGQTAQQAGRTIADSLQKQIAWMELEMISMRKAGVSTVEYEKTITSLKSELIRETASQQRFTTSTIAAGTASKSTAQGIRYMLLALKDLAFGNWSLALLNFTIGLNRMGVSVSSAVALIQRFIFVLEGLGVAFIATLGIRQLEKGAEALADKLSLTEARLRANAEAMRRCADEAENFDSWLRQLRETYGAFLNMPQPFQAIKGASEAEKRLQDAIRTQGANAEVNRAAQSNFIRLQAEAMVSSGQIGWAGGTQAGGPGVGAKLGQLWWYMTHPISAAGNIAGGAFTKGSEYISTEHGLINLKTVAGQAANAEREAAASEGTLRRRERELAEEKKKADRAAKAEEMIKESGESFKDFQERMVDVEGRHSIEDAANEQAEMARKQFEEQQKIARMGSHPPTLIQEAKSKLDEAQSELGIFSEALRDATEHSHDASEKSKQAKEALDGWTSAYGRGAATEADVANAKKTLSLAEQEALTAEKEKTQLIKKQAEQQGNVTDAEKELQATKSLPEKMKAEHGIITDLQKVGGYISPITSSLVDINRRMERSLQQVERNTRPTAPGRTPREGNNFPNQ